MEVGNSRGRENCMAFCSMQKNMKKLFRQICYKEKEVFSMAGEKEEYWREMQSLF